jgi:LAS superfamily LD-carboxypeptidase LdcB
MKWVNKIKKTVTTSVKNNLIFIRDYFLSWRFVVFLWVLFVGICLCYIFLFFSASKIEALITFPGWDINLKEITNHPAGLLISEKVSYIAPSWNTITGLYIDNNSEKIVYYFHGNWAPMEYFYSDIKFISDLWYSVIAHEFPGYGDSTGIPYIEENRDFSKIFYEKMQEQFWFQESDVIIWGYSIGTALAVDFAKDREFDSLILFSPLASRYDMWSKLLWFPLQKLFFLKNSYISKEIIKDIQEPTLIIHWNIDKVVPFEQWKLVFENSAASKKKFIEIDGFGHSLIPERYWEVLRWYISDFLNKQEESVQESKIFLDKDLALKILEKYQKEIRIENLDFITDDSITKYVDPSISFTEKWYIPTDMRKPLGTYIVDSKWNALMREQAVLEFERMAQAFYWEFNEKMVAVSTYRSYAYQAGIKSRWCPDNLCAKAGHSEHQSGLTVDLWSASSQKYWNSSARLTKFYIWLDDNAYLYGFHNGYRNGVDIDGYDIEPWHWRYLWGEFALYLHDADITFAQHYYETDK